MKRGLRTRLWITACVTSCCLLGSARPAAAQTCQASLRGQPDGVQEATSLACSTDPPMPALLRDVTTIQADAFQSSHMPPLRTSDDGRIGLTVDAVLGKLFLLSPERLGARFAETQDPVAILSDVDGTPLDRRGLTPDGNLIPGHLALCDAGRGWGIYPPGDANPYPCPGGSGEDCYDLVVLGESDSGKIDPSHTIQFHSTPITVRVEAAKTPQARIASVQMRPDLRRSSQVIPAPHGRLREPMYTSDGFLFVARLARQDYLLPERNSVPGAPTKPGLVQALYWYQPVGDPTRRPCDASKLTEYRPVSYAPYDPNLRDSQGEPRYGFAAYPFRWPDGTLIAPGGGFKETYPWIDRRGRNLFFTMVYDNLHKPLASGNWEPRYPTSCPSQQPCALASDPGFEPFGLGADNPEADKGATRGVSMLGSWTHGKMVLLDGMLNSIDFGLRVPDEHHRMLHLYSSSQTRESAPIRAGAGRDNQPHPGIRGYGKNSSIIDAAEQLFNASPDMRPLTQRDVVWLVNSGHGSAEIEFDDFLYPDGFIVSEMVQDIDSPEPNLGDLNSVGSSMDGFDEVRTGGSEKTGSRRDGWGGVEEVRVQNAATAPRERWAIPPFGRVHGFARVENVALGGVHGKGLWLEEQSGISYEIPRQGTNGRRDPADTDWYFGLFVDPRWTAADDPATGVPPLRDLVTFPDGASVKLRGRDTVLLVDGSQQIQASFSLTRAGGGDELDRPDPTANNWTHLGFVVTNDGGGILGTQVDFYLRGYLWDRWVAAPGDVPLFVIPTAGSGDETLHVGQVESSTRLGFRGWVDEFKVFAFQPDVEVACEMARGTLISVSGLDPATSAWRAAADRRGTAIQSEVAARLGSAGGAPVDPTICYQSYTEDSELDLVGPPAGSIPLRRAAIFPEGPLEVGQPRPDSSGNPHCGSCHVDSDTGGWKRPAALTTAALLPDPGGAPLEQDPRRFPSAPPARLHGVIVAGMYGPGVPPTGLDAPPAGCSTDALLSPAGGGAVPDDWCQPECSDGVDNDGDNLFDFPDDPGCRLPSSASESPACDDGLDNDGDLLSDRASVTPDPGCAAAWSDTEAPECSNGVDDDGDRLVDLADPGCVSASSASESGPVAPSIDTIEGEVLADRITVSGTARDPDGDLRGVLVQIDAGNYVQAAGTQLWSLTSAPLAPGPHTVSVIAYDSRSNLSLLRQIPLTTTAACVSYYTSIYDHYLAGRAHVVAGSGTLYRAAYAVGSEDFLTSKPQNGTYVPSAGTLIELRESPPGYFEKGSCP